MIWAFPAGLRHDPLGLFQVLDVDVDVVLLPGVGGGAVNRSSLGTGAHDHVDVKEFFGSQLAGFVLPGVKPVVIGSEHAGGDVPGGVEALVGVFERYAVEALDPLLQDLFPVLRGVIQQVIATPVGGLGLAAEGFPRSVWRSPGAPLRIGPGNS